MTAVLAREAFGAEFVGAEGFLNSPTYGLPPQFLIDALQDCIGQWQTGTMDVPSFDDYVRAGRAGYAALTGVPVDSVTMGGTVSSVLGLVAAAVPDGSRVATLAGEFTSTTFPFAAQAARRCHDHRDGARSNWCLLRPTSMSSRPAWCSPPTARCSTSTPCGAPWRAPTR